MKRILFTGILGAMFLTSCSTVQQAQQQQNNRAEFLSLKGTWEITSVDYSKNFKIKPFDEGIDARCFVGSTWNLIPNNWTGSYSIHSNENCPSITQPIKFEIANGNQFLFKKIYAGEKAKQNTAGYVLGFEKHSDNTFTLIQDIPFEGEYIKVYYQFKKTN